MCHIWGKKAPDDPQAFLSFHNKEIISCWWHNNDVEIFCYFRTWILAITEGTTGTKEIFSTRSKQKWSRTQKSLSTSRVVILSQQGPEMSSSFHTTYQHVWIKAASIDFTNIGSWLQLLWSRMGQIFKNGYICLHLKTFKLSDKAR